MRGTYLNRDWFGIQPGMGAGSVVPKRFWPDAENQPFKPALLTGFRREAADVFHEMGAFMTEMLDSLPTMGGGGSLGDATYEHLKEMNGFPVRTLEYGDDGVLDGQSTLISSKEVDFDPADFHPPNKYKRKDMMKGMK